MNEIVKLILSLSLSGSILALIILAIKPLIRNRISKSIQYYLWVIVIIRLLVPVSFEKSLMNEVFYKEKAHSASYTSNSSFQTKAGDEDTIISNSDNLIQRDKPNNIYTSTASINKIDLLKDYTFYIWITGAATVLFLNLLGYARFLKLLRKSNTEATIEENKLFNKILNGRGKVGLKRNKYITTPMLIGSLRPCIIIPDMNFNEDQLKNIILHEIIHYKRFDIVIKWMTMAASSLHWFNPLMYIIKKKINCACELSCDEAAIKSLTNEEKQAYGQTLIAISAERNYSSSVLQATMCEEKKNLKERLASIIRPYKKSKLTIIVSVVLLITIAVSALYLGAGVRILSKDTPSTSDIKNEDMPKYNLTELAKYKTPYIGDNSKVSGLASNLPVPDSYFKQRYISMETEKKPYKLNVFYEPNDVENQNITKSIDNVNSTAYSYLRNNALVLFAMVDNMEEVSFCFRGSPSQGGLEVSAYHEKYTFIRNTIEKESGNLSALSKDLDALQAVLNKVKSYTHKELVMPETYTDIDKLPNEYNSELAIKSGDIVYAINKIYNFHKLENFYTDFKEGKKDKTSMVRITMYTVEGDAIIHDLINDRGNISLIIDTKRDKYSSPDNRKKEVYKVSEIIVEEKNDKIIYKIKDNKGIEIYSFYKMKE